MVRNWEILIVYKETGRHRNIARSERKSTFCNLNGMEDEYHFVKFCHIYSDLRILYIPRYYFMHPSMVEFIDLLNICWINKQYFVINHLVSYKEIWRMYQCMNDNTNVKFVCLYFHSAVSNVCCKRWLSYMAR
jgi:hypothetical protein